MKAENNARAIETDCDPKRTSNDSFMVRLSINGTDFFFGLNISNFVVGHGYIGRVNDVDIRPYVMNVADLSFPFAASGNDFRAVLLQLGDNMQVSVRVRGVQRVSFGLESNEFRLLQLYSNILET